MPPKNCGSCQKLVYPMDELKCLDKTWHKACFRCQVCSMTLNMKNYKGYNKLPYCNAHYPTTKFTAVADTPENMRIKKNTKIQSNVKYHEEFEAAKGQYTAVADDPETMRVRKNMSTISNVAYHGEMQRKLEMENARPSEIEASSNGSMGPPAAPAAPAARSRKPGSISDYDPAGESRPSPFSSRTQSTTAYASANGQRQDSSVDEGAIDDVQVYSRSRRIGSITDYDPINDQYGSIVGQHPVSVEQPASTPAPVAAPRVASQPSPVPRQSSPPLDRQTSPPVARQPPVRDSSPPPVIRQSSPPVAREPSPPPVRQPSPPPVREPSPPPVREPSPPPVREPSPPPVREPSPPPVREPSPPPVREPSPLPVREPSPPPVREPSPPPVVPESSPPATANPYEGKGNVSMAVYEYAAGDDDEVSFEEGDIIIHCDPIDEGWMNGTVEKSGQSGMLPSNYVERVNW